MILSIAAAAVLIAATCVSACDDPHGIHCISGAGPKAWECPIRLFDKEKRGITDTLCSQKCCLCITKFRGGRCTPDDLVENAEIFINPYFANFPVNGTCGWCPKGTAKKYYSHKCYDQRVVGFEGPQNECKDYKPVKTGVFPNGPGNEPPPPIDIKAAFDRFPTLPPRLPNGDVPRDSDFEDDTSPTPPTPPAAPLPPTFQRTGFEDLSK